MTPDRTSLFYDWPGEDHLGFWKRERVKSFVYVIQGHPKGPVKIGVAKDVHSRRASLQTGNHATLRILLVAPGDQKLERQLHKRLAGARVQGEWFGGPSVAAFLDWFEAYCYQAIEHCRETGEIRRAVEPEPEKPARSIGLRPVGGYTKSKLQHRWRVRSGEDAPVSVRFVKPDPRPLTREQEIDRALRRGERDAGLEPSTPIHPASLSQH